LSGIPKGPASVRTSYRELISFISYFRHFGAPVIIGGWAVYFYNPYYGSVDIDVVGPSLSGPLLRLVPERPQFRLPLQLRQPLMRQHNADSDIQLSEGLA
jgi:hypothetical protein